MTGKNSFSNLTRDMSPERRAAIEARKIDLREEMELSELRKAIGLSQEELAGRLGVKQPAIAKLEQRSNMRVQKLQQLIEGMGGSLEIRAHFPQGDVEITNFAQATK